MLLSNPLWPRATVVHKGSGDRRPNLCKFISVKIGSPGNISEIFDHVTHLRYVLRRIGWVRRKLANCLRGVRGGN